MDYGKFQITALNVEQELFQIKLNVFNVLVRQSQISCFFNIPLFNIHFVFVALPEFIDLINYFLGIPFF